MHDSFAAVNTAANDFCGGKPGLSPLPLTLTLTLTLRGKNTLRNAEWRQRVLCGILDAEKHAELGIICGIKNAEKSCYSLLTFDNVSTAVLCAGRGAVWGSGGLPPPQNFVIKSVCPHPTPHFYSRSR